MPPWPPSGRRTRPRLSARTENGGRLIHLARVDSNRTKLTSATARLLASLVVLLAALTEGVLSRTDAQAAGTQLDLPLLAVIGAGYVGYVALRALRSPWALAFRAAPSRRPRMASGAFAAPKPTAHERWPLLVALLLGPLVFLFAGLGGWVEDGRLVPLTLRASQYPVA